MKVVVDSIPPEGLIFSETQHRDWLTNIPEFQTGGEMELTEAIALSGAVTLEGRNLRLKGKVATRYRTMCSRCGDEVEQPLAGTFDLVLLPGSEEADPGGELEISPEDLDRTYYQGPEVELDDFFREELALAIPYQSLCREDCRGLCPRCGANRNREQCSCPQAEGDPRLAALRGLKLKS